MTDKLKKWMMPILLIVLIPHLINIATGIMMNDKQLRELPMAVYLGDQTSLTRQIVRSFDDTNTFEVVAYKDSAIEVEEAMSRGEVVFGLVIPKDFTKDLKKSKSPTIVTLIDGTQLSTAAFTKLQSTEVLLTTKIGAMVATFKGKFNLSTTEALNTARPIEIASRIIGNPTRNYVNFLLPGLMTALAQVGIVMASASLIKRGSYKGEKFSRVFLVQWMQYTVLATLSITILLLIQSTFFGVPFKGGLGYMILLTFLFTGAVVSMSMFFSTIFKDPVLATQAGAVFFIPSSIISGYTWPLVAMPSPIQKLATIMPFTYYGDFVRSWMLSGRYASFEYNCFVLILMIACGAVGSMLIEGISEKTVSKEALVLEHE